MFVTDLDLAFQLFKHKYIYKYHKTIDKNLLSNNFLNLYFYFFRKKEEYNKFNIDIEDYPRPPRDLGFSILVNYLFLFVKIICLPL